MKRDKFSDNILNFYGVENNPYCSIWNHIIKAQIFNNKIALTDILHSVSARDFINYLAI